MRTLERLRSSRFRLGLTLTSLMIVLALAACSSDSTSETTESPAEITTPSTETTVAPTTTTVPPEETTTTISESSPIPGLPDPAPAGSLDGLTIGYFNFTGDPFTDATTADVEAQVEAAGGTFSFCDVTDAATTLQCFRNFNSAGVDGIIGFNGFPDAVSGLCAAGPDVPWVALYIPAGDCSQVVVMGNEEAAGIAAGRALGELSSEQFGCEIAAYVQMGDVSAGEVNTVRMGSMREGYEEICGPLSEEQVRIGDDDRTSTTDAARTYMANVLQAVTDGPILVAGLNDNSVTGAFAAARAQNRLEEVWAVSIGAGADFLAEVENPQWVASAAFFPEAYGRVAVPALVKLLNGEPVDEQLLMPTAAITSDNVNEFYPGTIDG